MSPPPARRRRRLRRLLYIVAGVIVGAYVLICVGIFFAQPYLIYMPAPTCHLTPADLKLEFEDLTLHAADGVALAAWYLPHAAPRGTVLFCHGNADNLGDITPTLQTLHRLGFAVLALDYRGYGRSAGQPTEAGLYADAEAAWRYLVETRREPPERIVIVGRSLGGAVAIELASRHTPAALVVECTFTSMVDIGRREYPLLPVGLICTHRYESLRRVGRISCPKLFLHGRDDELIPLENARRLFDAACEPKQFIETPGGHNTAGFEHNWEYTQMLDDWLARVTPATQPHDR